MYDNIFFTVFIILVAIIVIKYLNSIWKFIWSNKVLTLGFVIASVIFISYEVTMDWPEIITHGDFYYNLLSQLSLSFMGCFIFYIMQVYIPELERNKKIKLNIKRNIGNILDNMYIPIEYIVTSSGEEFDRNEYKLYDFADMLTEFDINEEIEGTTVLNYISHHIDLCEMYIDNLYDFMILDMDLKLSDMLDDIKKSDLQSIFTSRTKIITQLEIEDELNKDEVEYYYELYQKLKKYYETL